MKSTRLIPIVMAFTWIVSGCGVELGVESVRFPLEPSPIFSVPAGLDGSLFAVIALSSGEVMVDVHDDRGMVMATGLPELPPDYSYSVMLMFAHEDREGLPGGAPTEEVGHAHGALLPAPGGELESVAVGALLPAVSTGEWTRVFNSAIASDESPGSLRAGMIMLMPPMGTDPPVMVLFGDVTMGGNAAEGDDEDSGGGHAHGA